MSCCTAPAAKPAGGTGPTCWRSTANGYRSASRIDLLRNLARHVRDNAPLLASLSQTRAFTAFVQAVRDHPGPTRIPAEWVDRAEDRYQVHSIDKIVESAAETMSLFSELGVPWAK